MHRVVQVKINIIDNIRRVYSQYLQCVWLKCVPELYAHERSPLLGSKKFREARWKEFFFTQNVQKLPRGLSLQN